MDQPKFRYTVRGSWPFPLDMLRHDMSAAATPAEQVKIDLYAADHAADASVFHPIEIELVGWCKPNGARWESFGWELPFDADWQLTKRWKAEAREKEELRKSGLAKLTPEERKALEVRDAA